MGEIGLLICILIYAFWSTQALNRLIAFTGFTFFTSNIVGYIGIAMLLGMFLIPLDIVIAVLRLIFRLIFGRK